ncbi:MAG: HRDC domain-containing protein [Desulfovibrio sp.]|jgi:superfamily II DNA helicase RecQ|nr:HRDC domain-containing protein [Desulfovibrio sp.]
MALQYKFFSLPVSCEREYEEELNSFLRSRRIVSIQKELVRQDGGSFWAIAVEYATGEGKDARKSDLGRRKIDYKEELSPENFAIFVKLRDWRKETAAKEAVQLYAIFMNEQLAAMVEKRVTTKSGLLEIDGIGSGKVEKYGDAVLAVLNEEFRRLEAGGETGETPVSADSRA